MQIKRFSFKQIQFPHFHRIITAVFFVALSGLNIFSSFLFPPDTEKALKYALLRSPGEKTLHEKLGQYYLLVNQEAAAKEYVLAQEFYTRTPAGSSSVLGEEASPEETWKQILGEKGAKEAQIQLWESVSHELPSYTYAWLKLAVLYHQLDNPIESKKYIQKLVEENPGNAAIREVISKLGRTPKL